MLGDGVGNAWRVALDRVLLPPGIGMRSTYLGRILADARGRTLYWQRDPKAICTDVCLATWSPFAAPWLARPLAGWNVASGADGGKIWAYRGRQLYLHPDDLKPGDTNGLAAGKDWEVAVLDPAPSPPSWVTVQNADMGEVYADARGHTLYVFSGQLDKVRQLVCNDDCIRRNWQTNAAAPNTPRVGDWSAVPSPLGVAGMVWAYKGNVLYTHNRDREPGAVGGDKWAAGVGGGGGGWGPVLRRRDFDE
jgi:predicted lipoprotein with Yx(FWY)xxD motif